MKRKSSDESYKETPSKLKGKKYEDIMEKTKANKLKENKSKQGLNQYKQDVMDRLEEMNLELLDKEYKGIKYEHKFKCKICGDIFTCKYITLKRRKVTCLICENINPKQTK